MNTQRLIDTIYGDEKDLDIEVAEPKDETSPPVAAGFHVEHNDEDEQSELDLLSLRETKTRRMSLTSTVTVAATL